MKWYDNSFFSSLTLLILFSLLSGQAKAVGVDYTEEDKVIFERYLATVKSQKDVPVQGLIIETALFFLGTPYVGATLEKEPERLVVNLREMDCSTFVENVISLVRTVKEGNPSFESFCRNLQQLRYREGDIKDYMDRLHYTSDWIFENERKGLLKDVTKEVGGKPLSLSLSFMSTHPESYRQLKDNPDRIGKIKEKEREISARSYYFIPEADIERLRGGMQNGDIVGFVTTINGLDLSHVGIVYWKGDQLTFIHASSSAVKKVIVNEDSLSSYVKRIKSNKGVMIIRPFIQSRT